jgi:hypothetical protein
MSSALALGLSDLLLTLCSSVYLIDEEGLSLLPYECTRRSSSCKERRDRKRKTLAGPERQTERRPFKPSLQKKSDSKNLNPVGVKSLRWLMKEAFHTLAVQKIKLLERPPRAVVTWNLWNLG